MNREIERKFLADKFDTTLAYDKTDIRQGYICSAEGKVIRVRTRGKKGYITLKYRISKLSRAEFEYEIPYDDAVNILDNMCEGRVLEKTRYLYNYESRVWEIDVFKGKNEGIILAEIELSSEEEEFKLPPFIGKEVTEDGYYSNHRLAERNKD